MMRYKLHQTNPLKVLVGPIITSMIEKKKNFNMHSMS